MRMTLLAAAAGLYSDPREEGLPLQPSRVERNAAMTRWARMFCRRNAGKMKADDEPSYGEPPPLPTGRHSPIRGHREVVGPRVLRAQGITC